MTTLAKAKECDGRIASVSRCHVPSDPVGISRRPLLSERLSARNGCGSRMLLRRDFRRKPVAGSIDIFGWQHRLLSDHDRIGVPHDSAFDIGLRDPNAVRRKYYSFLTPGPSEPLRAHPRANERQNVYEFIGTAWPR